jgi:hypothetical protein
MIASRSAKSNGAYKLLYKGPILQDLPETGVDTSDDHREPQIQVSMYKKFLQVLVRRPELLRIWREADDGSRDKIYTLVSVLQNFCSYAQESKWRNILSWRRRQPIARDTFTEFGGGLKQSPGMNNGYCRTRLKDVPALRLWVDARQQQEANNPTVPQIQIRCTGIPGEKPGWIER